VSERRYVRYLGWSGRAGNRNRRRGGYVGVDERRRFRRGDEATLSACADGIAPRSGACALTHGIRSIEARPPLRQAFVRILT